MSRYLKMLVRIQYLSSNYVLLKNDKINFYIFQENGNPGDHKVRSFMASIVLEKKFVAPSISSEAATGGVL